MPYSANEVQNALRELQTRRQNSEFELQKQTTRAFREVPELQNIQMKLAQVGLSLSRILFTKGNKKDAFNELKEESLNLQKERAALLKAHNLSPDTFEIKHVCQICKDSGYVNGKPCVCLMDLLKEEDRKRIRRNAPIDACTFDSFNTAYYPNGEDRETAEGILEALRLYAQQFGAKSKNILLLGGTGLGKTHLALAMANVVINRGYSVTFGTVPSIMGDLSDEKFKRDDNTFYTEKEVMSNDLLILDDLGAEYKTSYTKTELYNIINTRILREKPTVITSNCSLDDIQSDYDQRVTSRLIGDYSILTLSGGDIRFEKNYE